MTLSSAFSHLRYGFRLVAVVLVVFSGPGAVSPLLASAAAKPGWRAHGRERARGLLLTHLLSTLNLTEQRGGPDHHQHHPHQMGPQRTEAPRETTDYMLELYHQFARDSGAAPSAPSTVVRSFRNHDSSPYRVTAGGTRVHPLLFNISVPRRERTRLAQLRLHTAPAAAAPPISSTCTRDRKVTVYEVHQGAVLGRERRRGGDPEEEEEEEEEEVGLVPLATKRIRAKGSENWVSFDLTPAVEMWRASGYTTHRLEVHVHAATQGVRPGAEEEEGRVAAAEITKEEEEEQEEEEEDDDVVVIERNVESERNVVMVVFSDPDPAEDSSGDLQQGNDGSQDPRQTVTDDHQRHLQRPPGDLEVEQDAVWGAVRENEGHGSQEPSDEPSQEQQQELRSKLIYPAGAAATPPARRLRPRPRRDAKSKPCKRSPLYVDFKDIGWDQWVIQPTGYEAYECSGVCSMPMTAEVSPTKHAMVQTLLSHRWPKKTARACCVPTKLDAITLLYLDGGVVTVTHKYEDMVVLKCGCR